MWGTRMQVREIGAAAAGTCVRTAGAAFKDTSKSGKHAILAILGSMHSLLSLESLRSLLSFFWNVLQNLRILKWGPICSCILYHLQIQQICKKSNLCRNWVVNVWKLLTRQHRERRGASELLLCPISFCPSTLLHWVLLQSATLLDWILLHCLHWYIGSCYRVLHCHSATLDPATESYIATATAGYLWEQVNYKLLSCQIGFLRKGCLLYSATLTVLQLHYCATVLPQCYCALLFSYSPTVLLPAFKVILCWCYSATTSVCRYYNSSVATVLRRPLKKGFDAWQAALAFE